MFRDEHIKIKHLRLSEVPKASVGDVFGRLTVIKQVPYEGSSYKPRKTWLCSCTCGNQCKVLDQNIRSMKTTSCGCVLREVSSLRLPGRKIGNKQTKAYMAWRDMIQRTTNVRSPYYSNYGGRGITVCAEWKSFDEFISDMGEPADGESLERVDNNKGYSKENCKWATMKEQQRNKRTAKLVEIDGIVKCAAQWIEDYGIPESCFRARLRKGVTGAALLSKPRSKNAKRK